MNIVKWINNHEMELSLSSDISRDSFRELGYRLYKNSKSGSRRGPSFYYLRLELENEYSDGPYSFPENKSLERLCIRLHNLGFVFWGTFKTEISPHDYMKSLQRKGLLKSAFLSIQAGSDEIVSEEYVNV